MAPFGAGGSAIKKTIKTLTFTGAAGLGAVGSASIFTITGEVLIHALIAFCTTGLTTTTTGSISLGTTQQVARFVALIAASAGDHPIDTGEYWVSTTPTPGSIDLPDAMQSVIVSEDDIIATITVAAFTAGVVEFTVFWEPISADGNLVAA